MGVKISAMVFASGPRVLAQHSVMIALADNADDFGIAWPGLELLADKSRMTIRNLSRVLDALERDGWLVRRSRARGEHRRGSVYELNMARLGAAEAKAADVPRATRAPAPCNGVPRETKRSTVNEGDKRGTNEGDKRGIAGNLSSLDTVSSHAADEGADAAACAPRLDILSGAADEVQSEPVTGHPGQRDWTSSAPRLDIALADLVLGERDAKQNRQEPPLEPSFPPKPPRGGGIACSLDAAREGNGNGDSEGEDAAGVGLTAEEFEELAEVNAIRARRTPPEPPWPAAEWARMRVQEARIANPTDPMPVRSRRRRWNRQQ